MQPNLEYDEMMGYRSSWGMWPTSRITAGRAIVPFGALYTPLKQISELPCLGVEPCVCQKCGSVLNPFWFVFLPPLSTFLTFWRYYPHLPTQSSEFSRKTLGMPILFGGVIFSPAICGVFG